MKLCSGKDTFINFCLKELKNYGFGISSIDFVKDIAKQCGWDGEKTEKNRLFLSNLKKILADWGDVPFLKVVKKIDEFFFSLEQYGILGEGVAFIVCREPEEIERYVRKYHAITILITRSETDGLLHFAQSDNDIKKYLYDFTIENDGTVEDLEQAAKNFIKELRGK